MTQAAAPDGKMTKLSSSRQVGVEDRLLVWRSLSHFPEVLTMKRTLLVALGLSMLSVPFAATAAGDHTMSHDGATMPMNMQDTPMSDGQIKKIDAAKGMVTIKHGPLHGLGMGAMTMSFHVANPAMLKDHQPGDMIRFMAENHGGQLTVTEMHPAK
jgi:Cu/Ag efflux protein CusF